MKAKVAGIVVVLVVALSILVSGTLLVAAQTRDKYAPIVHKIAEKFNLELEAVNEVFKEHHEDEKAGHEARREEKLDETVDRGKITAEQKRAVRAKMAQMKEGYEQLKDLPPEERREAIAEQKKEIMKWADENDIDLEELAGHGSKGLGKGPRGFRRPSN